MPTLNSQRLALALALWLAYLLLAVAGVVASIR